MTYNRQRSSWKTKVKSYSFLILLLLLFVLILGGCELYKTTEETVTFTVKKTERDYISDGKSRYLVFTKEGEVFEVSDSWAYMRFRGSDLYNRLDEGNSYTCTVAGWRMGAFSTYRNIIEIKQIRINNEIQ